MESHSFGWESTSGRCQVRGTTERYLIANCYSKVWVVLVIMSYLTATCGLLILVLVGAKGENSNLVIRVVASQATDRLLWIVLFNFRCIVSQLNCSKKCNPYVWHFLEENLLKGDTNIDYRFTCNWLIVTLCINKDFIINRNGWIELFVSVVQLDRNLTISVWPDEKCT